MGNFKTPSQRALHPFDLYLVHRLHMEEEFSFAVIATVTSVSGTTWMRGIDWVIYDMKSVPATADKLVSEFPKQCDARRR